MTVELLAINNCLNKSTKSRFFLQYLHPIITCKSTCCGAFADRGVPPWRTDRGNSIFYYQY